MDKHPIDTEQMMRMAEAVVSGHPEEAQLRTLLDLGCRFAFANQNEDEPHRISVYLTHPEQGELLIGDFDGRAPAAADN